MRLDDMIAELSPSAQRAVQRYVTSLHLVEQLVTPAQGQSANCAPDPKRLPGSLDAAGALRRIVAMSADAERARRRAHRTIVGIGFRASSVADRTSKRLTGDVPLRDGCRASEHGVVCGLPVHAQGLCSKHYRAAMRRRLRR